METPTRTPVLRLVTINSDESKVQDATRTVALLHPDTGKALDGVTAVVSMIGDARYREITEAHREPDKRTGKVEWKIDLDAVTLEVLTVAVLSWSGVVGADGKPVPVTGAVLKALDFFNKSHLAGVARTPAEVVDAEVVAASFRESADVGRVG